MIAAFAIKKWIYICECDANQPDTHPNPSPHRTHTHRTHTHRIHTHHLHTLPHIVSTPPPHTSYIMSTEEEDSILVSKLNRSFARGRNPSVALLGGEIIKYDRTNKEIHMRTYHFFPAFREM